MRACANARKGADPHKSRQRPAAATKDERDDDQHDADDQQNLREIGREAGNAAKTEQRRNQRDNREDKSISEHVGLLPGRATFPPPPPLCGDERKPPSISFVDVPLTLVRVESSGTPAPPFAARQQALQPAQTILC